MRIPDEFNNAWTEQLNQILSKYESNKKVIPLKQLIFYNAIVTDNLKKTIQKFRFIEAGTIRKAGLIILNRINKLSVKEAKELM